MACLACQSKISGRKRKGHRVGAAGGDFTQKLVDGALGVGVTAAAFKLTQVGSDYADANFKASLGAAYPWVKGGIGLAIGIGVPAMVNGHDEMAEVAKVAAFAAGAQLIVSAWNDMQAAPATTPVSGWQNKPYKMMGRDNNSYALMGRDNSTYALMGTGVPNPQVKMPLLRPKMGAGVPNPLYFKSASGGM